MLVYDSLQATADDKRLCNCPNTSWINCTSLNPDTESQEDLLVQGHLRVYERLDGQLSELEKPV